MRRLFVVFIAVAAALLYTASAREVSLRKLASVELQGDSLVHNDNMRTVEVVVAKRRTLGAFRSVRLYDIVAALPGVKAASRSSVVIVCEASDGRTCTTSLGEIDPDIVKLPALLLIDMGVETSARRDSFALSDTKGAKGTVDLSELDKQFSNVTRLRYVLSDAEISAGESKAFGALKMRLLFPYDRSSARWLADIKYIHVFIAE